MTIQPYVESGAWGVIWQKVVQENWEIFQQGWDNVLYYSSIKITYTGITLTLLYSRYVVYKMNNFHWGQVLSTFQSDIYVLSTFQNDIYITLQNCSCTIKNRMTMATHDRNALRKIYQWKCGSNLWTHPHFEASVKGFLIGISLPNFGNNLWNHISSSVQTQKCDSTECGSYEND